MPYKNTKIYKNGSDREIETKHILNIYNSMAAKLPAERSSVSAQQLLDYILSYHNDSDCKYIFDNLPQQLHTKTKSYKNS